MPPLGAPLSQARVRQRKLPGSASRLASVVTTLAVEARVKGWRSLCAISGGASASSGCARKPTSDGLTPARASASQIGRASGAGADAAGAGAGVGVGVGVAGWASAAPAPSAHASNATARLRREDVESMRASRFAFK